MRILAQGWVLALPYSSLLLLCTVLSRPHQAALPGACARRVERVCARPRQPTQNYPESLSTGCRGGSEVCGELEGFLMGAGKIGAVDLDLRLSPVV